MAGFTDLPSEVRNILYDNLLRGDNQSRHRDPNEFALFTVSKQLHQESSSFWYQHNNIAIDAPLAANGTATIVPPVPDKYLRFLKRLTIHTTTGHPSIPSTNKVATTIAALSTIGAHFDELNLIISSPMSHLLNSRVDDSVLHALHPITSAIKAVLTSGVAALLRIQLEDVWLAPGVARIFQSTPSTRVEFFDASGIPVPDLSALERALIGRYSSTHLSALGLDPSFTGNSRSSQYSPLSSLASIASSLSSAFADLDTFSVTSFELSSDEEEEEALMRNDSHKDDTDGDEQPFFTEDDIEEWSASTQESAEEQDGQALGERDDLDEDEDMEDVQDGETQAIMQNLQEAAHHVTNGDDVTYMINFAPDLLLSRHHLGHLA
jgi:hypothetical protein